jgi:4-hydroxythreonine-4-phosphate dehydrogenase
MFKPVIAITLGDPAGISLEVSIDAVNSLKVKRVCSVLVFGDSAYKTHFKNMNFVECSSLSKNIKIGFPSAACGIIAYKSIEKAVDYCMKKKVDALVTAPISKESFKMADIGYIGHTELLAALTKSKNVVMMMTCGKINAVMVTRHIPLCKVSDFLNTKNIYETVKLSVNFLQKSHKYKKNKIIFCGLNPHCGDNSILGNEEKQIVIPAVKKLRKDGFSVSGPIAADAAWLKMKNGQFDLICTMYHDQVMIPLKCINDQKIVNVTAGLPFIRTSPGHGTAFDIAGKNKANSSSMIEAILQAAYLSRQT